jgi:L-iditol 2-dehydrogenase
LISDRYQLKDLDKAVAQATKPTADTYKILLYPTPDFSIGVDT